MNTIAEYIKQHPNSGKVIVYTETYLQMRYTLMEQIATIEYNIKDTLLNNDADIRQKLLPSLKRTLKDWIGGFCVQEVCKTQYIAPD